MWEQYRKTFSSMQTFIALFSVAVFFLLGRSWSLAAGFFVVMQAGALFGAMWGARLKRRVNPPAW
jgi:uncharacterized membrane protein YfcA